MSGRSAAKFAAWAFFAPMALLIAADKLSSNSPLPLWRRLCTLEDACAYGSCVVLPALFVPFAFAGRAIYRRIIKEKT